MNRKLILALAIGCISLSATAQKKFEGTIIYSMEVNGTDIEPQQAAMMPTEKTTTVKGDMVKESMEAAFGSINTIINTKEMESNTFMDIMGNKMAFKMDKAMLDKMREKKPKMEVTFGPETKTIAGYTCKRAIAKNTEDNTQTSIWYTEELPRVSNMEGELYKDINGLLMEFVASGMGGTEMKFSAKKVNPAKVDEKEFVFPTDYKMMSADEMRQMGIK